jgi:hypothetical protein
MEAEIESRGLSSRYERLSATPGNPGWLGCFLSHMRALERINETRCITHITEDDSELSDFFPRFVQETEGIWQRFDMLFLDMWVDLQTIPRYLDALRGVRNSSDVALLNLKDFRVGCTSSYLVHPRCVPRLLEGLRHELNTERPHVIDNTYGDFIKSGLVRAAFTVPFITGTSSHAVQSDVQTNLTSDEVEMLLLVRSIFRLGQDLPATADRIDRLRSRLEANNHVLPGRYLDGLVAFARTNRNLESIRPLRLA